MVTTNLPDGVTNAATGSVMQTLPMPDPTRWYQWFQDFDRYNAATSGTCDWLATITQAGTGNATAVVADANGGILLVTNDDADDDNYFAQWNGFNSANVVESVKFVAGKQMWFKARFKVSNATQSDVIVGLAITDTSPLDASDGIFFLKADDAATIVMKVVKGSTATTTTVGTLVDDTYVELGFHYAGNQTIFIYKDGVRVASCATTNAPDTEELAVTFGLQNGSAGAKTMSLDYICVVNER